MLVFSCGGLNDIYISGLSGCFGLCFSHSQNLRPKHILNESMLGSLPLHVYFGEDGCHLVERRT